MNTAVGTENPAIAARSVGQPLCVEEALLGTDLPRKTENRDSAVMTLMAFSGRRRCLNTPQLPPPSPA